MLEKIKEMLYTFCYVTTGVVFSTSLFMTLFYRNDYIKVDLLWEIILTSFLCVLGNLLYPKNREISKKQIGIRIIIHYVYINLVVFGSAYWFEWFDFHNFKMIACMLLLIAVIFIVVSIVVWSADKKTSELLNKQLKEYQESIR